MAASETTTTSRKAGLIFFKSLFGAGILALPSAMNTVKLKLAFALYGCISLGCVGTCYALLKTKDIVQSHSPHLVINTYEDLVSEVLSKRAARIVRGTVVALNICFCTGFVIAINDNLNKTWSLGPGEIAVVLLPLLIALSSSNYLHQLWFVSFLGLLTYFAGVIGSSVYYVGKNWRENDSFINDVEWSQIPKFTGTAVYALEGICLVLPVQRQMNDQKEAMKVLVWISLPVYAVLTCTYSLIAAAGGLAENIDGETCDIVTDCFDPGKLADTLRIALSAALIVTHPVTLYPAIEMLEFVLVRKNVEGRETLINKNSPLLPLKTDATTIKPNHILRVSLVSLTVVVGALVKSFSGFSNVVGGVGLTFVGFVVPAICYQAVHKKHELPMNIFANILCWLCFAFGIFNALYSGIILNFE